MSLTPCTPVVYRCSSSGRALSPWEAEFAGYGPDESYDGKSAAATGRARAKAARSLLKKIKARVDEFPTSEKQDREVGAGTPHRARSLLVSLKHVAVCVLLGILVGLRFETLDV